MSKPAKIILLAATLWPLIYMCIFFGYIFFQDFSLADLLVSLYMERAGSNGI